MINNSLIFLLWKKSFYLNTSVKEKLKEARRYDGQYFINAKQDTDELTDVKKTIESFKSLVSELTISQIIMERK